MRIRMWKKYQSSQLKHPFPGVFGILLNLLHPKIDKIIVVIIIRKDPSCKGSRPTRPF